MLALLVRVEDVEGNAAAGLAGCGANRGRPGLRVGLPPLDGLADGRFRPEETSAEINLALG